MNPIGWQYWWSINDRETLEWNCFEENVDSQELIAKDPAGKTTNTNMACYILINTIEGIQKHALLIKVGY